MIILANLVPIKSRGYRIEGTRWLLHEHPCRIDKAVYLAAWSICHILGTSHHPPGWLSGQSVSHISLQPWRNCPAVGLLIFGVFRIHKLMETLAVGPWVDQGLDIVSLQVPESLLADISHLFQLEVVLEVHVAPCKLLVLALEEVDVCWDSLGVQEIWIDFDSPSGVVISLWPLIEWFSWDSVLSGDLSVIIVAQVFSLNFFATALWILILRLF